MLEPEQCNSMAEVRAGIDALDGQLMALLARRMRFMDAAARIKSDRTDVRDEARKRAVIANAVEAAGRLGFPADLARDLYEVLIEGSIAYEFQRFDAK